MVSPHFRLLVVVGIPLVVACGGSVSGEVDQDASLGEAGSDGAGEAGSDGAGEADADGSVFMHLCSNLPLPTGCEHVIFEREGDVGSCVVGCHSCGCSGSGWSCTTGPCQADAAACPADEPQYFCAQPSGTKCEYPTTSGGCDHDECVCDSSARWTCAAIGCADAGLGD